MKLIAEYEGGYLNAKAEIENIIRMKGDDKPSVEILVPGVIGVKTELNPRRVVEELRETQVTEPDKIKFLKRVAPVDEWCALGEVVSTVRDDFKSVIADALFRVDVVVHRGDANAGELAGQITGVLAGRYEENRPQKVVRVDVFDKQAAVSLVKELDVFSR